MKKIKTVFNSFFSQCWIVGLISFIWFLLRTGTKPSRYNYPCQKWARKNIAIFGLPFLIPLIKRFKKCPRFRQKVLFVSIPLFLLMICGGVLIYKQWKVKNAFSLITEISGQNTASRVVWITDSGAASAWAGDSSRVDANIVQRMADQAIMALAGTSSVNSAWSQIFRNHNGGADYQAGEKIAVKVNFNNSYNSGTSNNCYQDHCPTYQPVNALIRQLVNKGVAQSDIIIYDTSRSFPDYYVNGIKAAFPNVQLNPNRSCSSSQSVRGAAFGCVLDQAKYLINMPLLRTHGMAGVTLSFKNHLGSTENPSAFHSAFFGTSASTNSLVQLNSHPLIKDKTILVVDDALYGLTRGGPNGAPNIHPNSLFLSTDPVAADSVMSDYLQSQGAAVTNSANGDARTYLRVAAGAGLGNFGTSCSSTGTACSFSYSNINLIRCSGMCSNVPTGTSGMNPTFTPTRTPTRTPTQTPMPTSFGSFCADCSTTCSAGVVCPPKSLGNASCNEKIDLVDFIFWKAVYQNISDGISVSESEQAAVDFNCKEEDSPNHKIDINDFLILRSSLIGAF